MSQSNSDGTNLWPRKVLKPKTYDFIGGEVPDGMARTIQPEQNPIEKEPSQQTREETTHDDSNDGTMNAWLSALAEAVEEANVSLRSAVPAPVPSPVPRSIAPVPVISFAGLASSSGGLLGARGKKMAWQLAAEKTIVPTNLMPEVPKLHEDEQHHETTTTNKGGTDNTTQPSAFVHAAYGGSSSFGGKGFAGPLFPSATSSSFSNGAFSALSGFGSSTFPPISTNSAFPTSGPLPTSTTPSVAFYTSFNLITPSPSTSTALAPPKSTFTFPSTAPDGGASRYASVMALASTQASFDFKADVTTTTRSFMQLTEEGSTEGWQTGVNPFTPELTPVLVQLTMQCLDLASIMAAARACKFLRAQADTPFTWQQSRNTNNKDGSSSKEPRSVYMETIDLLHLAHPSIVKRRCRIKFVSTAYTEKAQAKWGVKGKNLVQSLVYALSGPYLRSTFAHIDYSKEDPPFFKFHSMAEATILASIPHLTELQVGATYDEEDYLKVLDRPSIKTNLKSLTLDDGLAWDGSFRRTECTDFILPISELVPNLTSLHLCLRSEMACRCARSFDPSLLVHLREVTLDYSPSVSQWMEDLIEGYLADDEDSVNIHPEYTLMEKMSQLCALERLTLKSSAPSADSSSPFTWLVRFIHTPPPPPPPPAVVAPNATWTCLTHLTIHHQATAPDFGLNLSDHDIEASMEYKKLQQEIVAVLKLPNLRSIELGGSAGGGSKMTRAKLFLRTYISLAKTSGATMLPKLECITIDVKGAVQPFSSASGIGSMIEPNPFTSFVDWNRTGMLPMLAELPPNSPLQIELNLRPTTVELHSMSVGGILAYPITYAVDLLKRRLLQGDTSPEMAQVLDRRVRILLAEPTPSEVLVAAGLAEALNENSTAAKSSPAAIPGDSPAATSLVRVSPGVALQPPAASTSALCASPSVPNQSLPSSRFLGGKWRENPRNAKEESFATKATTSTMSSISPASTSSAVSSPSPAPIVSPSVQPTPTVVPIPTDVTGGLSRIAEASAKTQQWLQSSASATLEKQPSQQPFGVRMRARQFAASDGIVTSTIAKGTNPFPEHCIPAPMAQLILRYLDTSSLCRCSHVSRWFRTQVDTKSAWLDGASISLAKRHECIPENDEDEESLVGAGSLPISHEILSSKSAPRLARIVHLDSVDRPHLIRASLIMRHARIRFCSSLVHGVMAQSNWEARDIISKFPLKRQIPDFYSGLAEEELQQLLCFSYIDLLLLNLHYSDEQMLRLLAAPTVYRNIRSLVLATCYGAASMTGWRMRMTKKPSEAVYETIARLPHLTRLHVTSGDCDLTLLGPLLPRMSKLSHLTMEFELEHLRAPGMMGRDVDLEAMRSWAKPLLTGLHQCTALTSLTLITTGCIVEHWTHILFPPPRLGIQGKSTLHTKLTHLTILHAGRPHELGDAMDGSPGQTQWPFSLYTGLQSIRFIHPENEGESSRFVEKLTQSTPPRLHLLAFRLDLAASPFVRDTLPLPSISSLHSFLSSTPSTVTIQLELLPVNYLGRVLDGKLNFARERLDPGYCTLPRTTILELSSTNVYLSMPRAAFPDLESVKEGLGPVQRPLSFYTNFLSHDDTLMKDYGCGVVGSWSDKIPSIGVQLLPTVKGGFQFGSTGKPNIPDSIVQTLSEASDASKAKLASNESHFHELGADFTVKPVASATSSSTIAPSLSGLSFATSSAGFGFGSINTTATTPSNGGFSSSFFGSSNSTIESTMFGSSSASSSSFGAGTNVFGANMFGTSNGSSVFPVSSMTLSDTGAQTKGS